MQDGYLFAPAKGFPGSASGKEPACQCRRRKRLGFNPWVGKTPWRRTWQPTPVFLPGESHGGLQSTGSQSRTRLKLLGTHVSILRVISETLTTRGLKWSFDVLFAFCQLPLKARILSQIFTQPVSSSMNPPAMVFVYFATEFWFFFSLLNCICFLLG